MIVTRKQIAGFLGAGCVALGVVLMVNQRTNWQGLDPQTGKPMVSVESQIKLARVAGSVRPALDILLPLGPFAASPCPHEISTLLHEHGAPGSLPLQAPGRTTAVVDSINKELALREEVTRGMKGSPLEWELEHLTASTWVLLADATVERQTNDFFRADFARPFAAIDARAARLGTWTFDEALHLARRYDTLKRSRATARWSLRAWEMAPENPEATRRLMTALANVGLFEAAVRVAAAGPKDDKVLMKKQAEIARWIDDPELEIAVLESCVQSLFAWPEAFNRLVTIHLYSGNLEQASHFADLRATRQGTREYQLEAVSLAMQLGQVPRALAAVRRLSEQEKTSNGGTHWRDLELRILEQDQRYPEMERRLKELYLEDAEKYATPYEQLLRRTWSIDSLAAYLVDRAEAAPGNKALRMEAFPLAARAMDRDLLSRLLDITLGEGFDPAQALRAIRPLHGLGVSDAGARTAKALASRHLTPEQSIAAYEATRYAVLDVNVVDALVDSTFPVLDRADVRKEMLNAMESLDPGRVFKVFARLHDAGRAEDDVLREWAQQARWKGNHQEMLTAYGHLLERHPEDVSIRALRATELGTTRQFEVAFSEWQRVLDDAGSDPPFTWVEAAIVAAARASRDDQLLTWKRRFITPENPGPDSARAALAVGDALFESGAYRWAAEFYGPVLGDESAGSAEQGSQFLRYAQSLMELGRLRDAQAPLEKVAAAGSGDSTLARLLLADVYDEVGDKAVARSLYEAVADEIPASEWDRERAEWRARALVGAGRLEEGRDAFEAYCETAEPTSPAHLQLAGVYLLMGQPVRSMEKARAFLSESPTNIGALRTLAEAQLGTGLADAAVATLRRSTALEGQGSGSAVALVEALYQEGSVKEAAALAAATLPLRENDVRFAETAQFLREQAAPMLSTVLSSVRIADDYVYRQGLYGSYLMDNDKTRITAGVELSAYSGRSAALDEGKTEIQSSIWQGRIGAEHRLTRNSTIGGGAHLYPTANGPGSAGLWAAYRWADVSDSNLTFQVRAHGADLWNQTAAGVGLGGRTSGAQVDLFRNIGDSWFAGLEGRYARVSLHDELSDASEPMVQGRASLGYFLSLGEPQGQMAEPVRFDTLGALGVSPYFSSRPGDYRGDQLQIYAALDQTRLQNASEISQVLPIAEDARYVLLGGRLDRRLGDRMGGMVEVTAGTDLVTHDPAYSINGGVTYRPDFPIELFARGGFGQAIGRGTTDDEYRFLFGLNLRR